MGVGETVVFVALVVPVSVFILTVYVLSALGKSLGFRRKYVQLLLYIFEYGRKKIEKANKAKYYEHEVTQKAGEADQEDEEEDEEEEEELASTSEEGEEESDDDSNANPKEGGAVAVAVVEEKDKNEGDDGKIKTDNVNVVRRKRLLSSSGDAPLDLSLGGNENDITDEFELSDIFEFVRGGIEAIVEDQVTQRFVAEELKSWNLLTRTNRHYEFISWRLSFIWVVGFFIRYFLMLPCRVTICALGTLTLTSLTFLIGLIPPNWGARRTLNKYVSRFCFRLLARAFSAIVTYHTREYRPSSNGICVANHTSPIDVVLLASDSSYALVLFLTMSTALVGCIPRSQDALRTRAYTYVCLTAFEFLSWSISAVITHHDRENSPAVRKSRTGGGGICVANHTSPIDVLVLAVDQCYAMVGQSHGGFLGILQRALARASSHIWFERSEMKDREAVAKRLREHVEDSTKLPILIFPEGTCINNSAVMQFKKGSFEVGALIYPVAIKYDARFGDPFWDSSKYSMIQYLGMMMSSWAIVCDVWYLPPMRRSPSESAVDFANRVKAAIARKGGLVDLDWDGQLKRAPAKKEWREQQQLEYSKKFTASPRHRSTGATNILPQEDGPNPSS